VRVKRNADRSERGRERADLDPEELIQLLVRKLRNDTLTQGDARVAVDMSHHLWQQRAGATKQFATQIDLILLDAGMLPVGGWAEYTRARYWALLDAALGGREAVREHVEARDLTTWAWLTRPPRRRRGSWEGDYTEPDERLYLLQIVTAGLQVERMGITDPGHHSWPVQRLDDDREESLLYGGFAYFWPGEYKHTLRSPHDMDDFKTEDRGEVLRRRVHDLWIMAGLPFDASTSPTHEWLIAKGLVPKLKLSFKRLPKDPWVPGTQGTESAKKVHKALKAASRKAGWPVLLSAKQIREATGLTAYWVSRGLRYLVESQTVDTLRDHNGSPGRCAKYALWAKVPRGIF